MIKNLERKKYRKRSGIYIIRNLETGEEYVGSTINLYSRLNGHLNNLRKNKHENQFLQGSWNKYGEDNFWMGVEFDYDEIDEKKLRYIEHKVIDSYKTMYYECGFNLMKVDEDRTVELSPETRQRMTEAVSKKVESYNILTGEIIEYPSGRAAFGHGGLADVVREMRVAKGHFWFYKGDLNLERLEKCFYKMLNPRPHKEKANDRSEVFDSETGIFYNTISELARTTHYHKSTFHTKLLRGDFGSRYIITKQAVRKKRKTK